MKGRSVRGADPRPSAKIELELKGGDAGEIFELARELGKHVSVKLALNSKSQRGYDLLDSKQIHAAPLVSGMKWAADYVQGQGPSQSPTSHV